MKRLNKRERGNIMSSTIFVIIFAILGVIIQLLLVRWVVQDAEKRGLNQILWGLIVFCTSFIGLCIYVWCKPKFPVKQS
jgi:ABC-type tungstate transport system substrate-binding protein